MTWPAREVALLLGGVLFAFVAWIPVVINVLPKLAGRDTGDWQWGFEHLPEFFGSQGASHAVMSWVVALIPYLLMQAGRVANWIVRTVRRRREAPEGLDTMPDQLGRERTPKS